MTRMFIVIKGSEAQARAAATEQKVELVQLSTNTVGTECYCYTATDTDSRKIVNWYSIGAGYNRPVQPGELLWYTTAAETEG